jgi:hypothetical protein
LLGRVPAGKRAIYDVTGGTFEGEQLQGIVLPGGGDWVLFDTQDVARLDVRVTLETHDGARIYTHYRGMLVPTDHFTSTLEGGGSTEYGDAYFVTQPHFETGDARYRWLNQVLAVAEGRGSREFVEYRIYSLAND